MNKIKNLNASFTVEAALVFPIVLFVIMTLIYMSFYLHDTAVIKSVVDKAVIKESMVIKHSSNLVTGEILYDEINERGVVFSFFGDLSLEKEVLEKYLEEQLKKNLFVLKIKQTNVEVSHSKTEVAVSTKVEVPLLGMREYLGGSSIKLTICGSAPVHYPAEYARMVEVVYDTTSNIKGFDQLKEKLQKFIKVFK